MPERRGNKARARINASERSRERNTCPAARPWIRLKGTVQGRRGGGEKKGGERGEDTHRDRTLIRICSRAISALLERVYQRRGRRFV